MLHELMAKYSVVVGLMSKVEMLYQYLWAY